jgi:branched-chain amino acid aminotransferase
MLNADGFLTEGTACNLFLVKENVVHTPELSVGILSGITRAQVLRMLAEEGMDCREGRYTRDDLLAADEVFITSTTRDAVPVRQVDDRVIGEGRAGPVARLLYGRFAAL